MERRKMAWIVLAVAAGALITFMLIPVLFPASAMDLPLHQGMSASYADGSCSYYQFKLDKAALITGAFTTNNSATFYVTVGAQSYQGSGGCLNVPKYYYTTGSVRGSSVNFTLAPGTYVVGFAFANQTGVQTRLNITKGFVASYIPTFIDRGPLCVSISCYQNNRGPEAPNGAR
jgi:hypothetical protein